jgi:hypothetical protein
MKTLRLVAGLSLFSFFAIPHGNAVAGMIAPCSAASMFPESDVTVFVLPYVDFTTPEASNVESPVGTDLAGLMQADTLLAIGRFGHVAAIRLMGRPADCQPDLVLKRLLSEFGGSKRKAGIIFLSGRIFRANDEIYVQSYASFSRFARNDPGEVVSLPFGDKFLTAQPAAQSFAFTPRRVTQDDLAKIRDRFARQSIVHESANEASPGKPLLVLFPNNLRPAYYMTDTQGEWIHIHTQTGQDGWILARAMLGTESLSARLPEMKFVEGLAGYFGFRAQPSLAKAELAQAAFVAFEQSALSFAAPVPLAVSKQMRGMLQLLAANQSLAAYSQTASLFAEGSDVAPSNSPASNFATVVGLYSRWRQPDVRIPFQETVDKFWMSISADPNNQTAIQNCWTMYTVASNPAFRERFTFEPVLTPAELQERARALETVQLNGKQVSLAETIPVAPWPRP